MLPKDIKEVCIYTSDGCKNISEFVHADISSKFEYLELGFNSLKLPVEFNNILDVARKFPNRGENLSGLSQHQFKNELVAATAIGAKRDRYDITHGPQIPNQFGYHWFEVKDLKKKVMCGRQSKNDFKSVRRNQEDNT